MNIFRDQCDLSRTVTILGDKGASNEKGSKEHYHCGVYFHGVYMGVTDIAKTSFRLDRCKRGIGYEQVKQHTQKPVKKKPIPKKIDKDRQQDYDF